jgi:hypothetical protein
MKNAASRTLARELAGDWGRRWCFRFRGKNGLGLVGRHRRLRRCLYRLGGFGGLWLFGCGDRVVLCGVRTRIQIGLLYVALQMCHDELNIEKEERDKRTTLKRDGRVFEFIEETRGRSRVRWRRRSPSVGKSRPNSSMLSSMPGAAATGAGLLFALCATSSIGAGSVTLTCDQEVPFFVPLKQSVLIQTLTAGTAAVLGFGVSVLSSSSSSSLNRF